VSYWGRSHSQIPERVPGEWNVLQEEGIAPGMIMIRNGLSNAQALSRICSICLLSMLGKHRVACLGVEDRLSAHRRTVYYHEL